MRYDVVVIGSGFGGSVAALRLVEKGYSVAVLEAGRRFADDEFPRRRGGCARSCGRRRWAGTASSASPCCAGAARRGARAGRRRASAAGLVYANTLYEPLADFYDDPQWRGITDWRAELAPHYDQAKRMLGVTHLSADDRRGPRDARGGRADGRRDTFHPTPVGVFLGRPGETVPDPYFGGAGPERTGCSHCGSCMTGCRHGAKNTLVKNYLWLAERAGARCAR